MRTAKLLFPSLVLATGLAACSSSDEGLGMSQAFQCGDDPDAGPTYVGCFSDSWTRALPTQLASGGATVESCIAAAAGKYTYVGVQYGGECWAGNTLGQTQLSYRGDAEAGLAYTLVDDWDRGQRNGGFRTAVSALIR